ncbi:MAG: hypothetical protein WAS33_19160 [Candidatus Promineifilaceae bacterium]
MRNQKFFRSLPRLIFVSLFILPACTPGVPGTDPTTEPVNSDEAQSTVEITPREPEIVSIATNEVIAEVESTAVPTVTLSSPTETPQPTPLSPATDSEGLQLLVATQDDSLAIWQDGTLNQMANTAGVFSAVFVGDSDNIAYVREHEVWCLDARTQAARQVPLPSELVAAIPYEYEAPHSILWLASLGYNSKIMGTVFHGTGAYGTILVDCDTGVSQLIESTHPGYPVLAPDGSKIAIAGTTAITVYDLVSGVSNELLMFEPIGTYTSASYFPILSWSPDSTQIVTVINPQDWWMEDIDETSLVYRLSIESGEIEVVSQINRMFVREPYTAAAYGAEKVAYSIPADPATEPFGYIPAKQMILDVSSGTESLLFEGNSGFMGWNPFFDANTRFTGLTPWNPAGERVIFWAGSDPFNQKFGVYDFSVGEQLEQRLPGVFAGWINDTSFLCTADGSLYWATITGLEIVSTELVPNVARVFQARISK